MFNAYLQAMRICDTYEDGNLLARILPSIEELEDDQIAELADAYNSNSQIYTSWGFNGTRPSTYGTGSSLIYIGSGLGGMTCPVIA